MISLEYPVRVGLKFTNHAVSLHHELHCFARLDGKVGSPFSECNYYYYRQKKFIRRIPVGSLFKILPLRINLNKYPGPGNGLKFDERKFCAIARAQEVLCPCELSAMWGSSADTTGRTQRDLNWFNPPPTPGAAQVIHDCTNVSCGRLLARYHEEIGETEVLAYAT
jgi:hypothetical protein